MQFSYNALSEQSVKITVKGDNDEFVFLLFGNKLDSKKSYVYTFKYFKNYREIVSECDERADLIVKKLLNYYDTDLEQYARYAIRRITINKKLNSDQKTMLLNMLHFMY